MQAGQLDSGLAALTADVAWPAAKQKAGLNAAYTKPWATHVILKYNISTKAHTSECGMPYWFCKV